MLASVASTNAGGNVTSCRVSGAAVSRHIMAVLTLGERQCCAAASNNSSNYRYENTHEFLRDGPHWPVFSPFRGDGYVRR